MPYKSIKKNMTFFFFEFLTKKSKVFDMLVIKTFKEFFSFFFTTFKTFKNLINLLKEI